MYSEITMNHFKNPRNVGSLNLPDGIGMLGDAGCGDQLTIYIKVSNGIISDIKFLVFGCVASIATSSMTTEMVKGMSLIDALKITEDDIINALGGLPEEKHHCSNLGVGALKAAINDYQTKLYFSKQKRLKLKINDYYNKNRDKLIHHMMVRLHGK